MTVDCLVFLASLVASGPAKLILYQGLKKLEINSRQCQAGIYMKNSTTFTCACVTGVWGFYHDYCSKPISIVGGDNYCFKLKNHSISQVVAFGSLKYPFEASLNVFQKGFFQMTGSHTDDNSTLSEPSSSFLTITDTSWTVYSDEGESLCLKATTSGKRKFCLFGEEIDPKSRDWKSITKVKRGCLSKNIRRADSCADILPPNDYTDCSLELLNDPMTEPSNRIDGNTTEEDIDPKYIPIKRVDIDDSDPPSYIPIKRIKTEGDSQAEIDTDRDSPRYIPIKVVDTDSENDDKEEEPPTYIPVKRIDTSVEEGDDEDDSRPIDPAR